MNEYTEEEIEQVAVIGMAVRFPDAPTVEQFWQNLRNGRNSLRQFTDEDLLERGVKKEVFSEPEYVKAGIVLDDIDLFDAEFFGYNAREAETMDPQQRIFLELAWEALENAGCVPGTYDGSIGVFGGTGSSDYMKRIPGALEGVTSGFDSFQAMMGNDVDFLTTRVSYKFDLTGPSFSLQTACSTSLVAVHTACQHLLTYQCDAALAGGVSIRLPQGVGYTYRDGMIWSPDGFCRAFDARAQGTIFGRGAGIVVLKRLSEAIADRDCIHAIIKGSAINNDGALKVGYTAPSVEGQSKVISLAHAISNTEPDTIGYVETHGTGTTLGDPIEIEALTTAFRAGTDKTGYCGIGSVKTNIGHLDVAAGIAGLIKAILALKHKEIPPSLFFERPNPNIDFTRTPFRVVDHLQPWEDTGTPRRAGVSSFGIGGTNAHVILEEAPPGIPAAPARSSQLLLLSAKSPEALEAGSSEFADFLRSNPDISLADAAFTLQTGRKHFPYRRTIVCDSPAQAAELLAREPDASSSPASTDGAASVFMFSGQGSQYITMGRGLYSEESIFRDQVDRCAEILLPHLALDLRDILFPAGDDTEAKELINQTYITQPALFVIEYSLASLLMHWEITPAAMVGHSIGEYVAACLAGVFSLDDALSLVAARGRMMQDLEPGTMLSVPLSEEEILPILPAELSIAVINAPRMTVVSGKTSLIDDFSKELLEKGLESKQLYTSHAFHSNMMDPIIEGFTQLVGSIERRSPQIPFVSNVSGTWITEEEAVSPQYWANHLRRTVRFYDCVSTLIANDFKNFIEVGPGQVLSILTGRHPGSRDVGVFSTTRRPVERKEDLPVLLDCLGKLWVSGTSINWQAFSGNESRSRIPLPTYPFQRRRYWIGAPEHLAIHVDTTTSSTQPSPAEPLARENKALNIQGPRNDYELQVEAIFCDLLGVNQVDIRDSLFDIGGDSLMAAQLLANLGKSFKTGISLADIFENPSVEALADLIRQGGGKSHSAVLPLNKGKGNNLIYFVVGIQLYQALARELSGTARCFGTFLPAEEALFNVGANGKEWTVADLAAAYREKIQNHSNGKPLSLVGVSFGGVVAYELARQLSREGQSIPLLVMMDSLLPSGMRRNNIKWLAAQTDKILKHGIDPAVRKLRAKLAERVDTRRRHAAQEQSRPNDDVPDQRLVVYADAVERFEKTEAESTYPGRTLLIQARDAERFPGFAIDSHFGWRKHITGEFHVDSAPGDHLGLLKPPNVKVTARIIERILQGDG